MEKSIEQLENHIKKLRKENDELYNKYVDETQDLNNKLNVAHEQIVSLEEKNFMLDEKISYIKMKCNDLIDSKLKTDKELVEYENKINEMKNNPFSGQMKLKGSDLMACKCLECGQILIRCNKFIVKDCECQ